MSKQARIPIHERPLKKFVSEAQLNIKNQIDNLRLSLNQRIDEDELEDDFQSN